MEWADAGKRGSPAVSRARSEAEPSEAQEG
jgi:hypothetical protein